MSLRGQCAPLRKTKAKDRRRSRRASHPERGLTDGPARNLCSCFWSFSFALLAGGVWIAHRAHGNWLRRACSSSAAKFPRGQYWRRRSGATARPGRSQRCRCSSGWAKFSFARGFRRRCSAGLRRGSTGFPGRLLHVNVLACGIFGSVSGSSAATCATVAKIALPELKKRGYDEMIALGSLAGAGTLGILIPPSIMMVIYAVAANVSILQVFLAGFPARPARDGAVLAATSAHGRSPNPERRRPPTRRCRLQKSCENRPKLDARRFCSSRSSSSRFSSVGQQRPNALRGACSARLRSRGGNARSRGNRSGRA